MISVIVPVYKVEAYLDDCIASLLAQTYTDLEIILVDDGSPDTCPARCDAWAEKDSRIVVIHKENGGLSDARNAGLRVARGAYIAFVDSDDYLAADFYETLLRAMEREDAQIAASGIVQVWEDRGGEETFFGTRYKQTVFTAEEALATLQRVDGFFAVAWNKLYRRDIFANTTYPVGKLHEDEFVTYRVMARATRLVLCQETTYYYRQRSGSIMATWSPCKLDALEALTERQQFIKHAFPMLYPEDAARFCIACVSYYRKLRHTPRTKDTKKAIRHYRRTCKVSLATWRKMTGKQKIYTLASAISLPFFAWMLNLCKQNLD